MILLKDLWTVGCWFLLYLVNVLLYLQFTVTLGIYEIQHSSNTIVIYHYILKEIKMVCKDFPIRNRELHMGTRKLWGEKIGKSRSTTHPNFKNGIKFRKLPRLYPLFWGILPKGIRIVFHTLPSSSFWDHTYLHIFLPLYMINASIVGEFYASFTTVPNVCIGPHP